MTLRHRNIAPLLAVGLALILLLAIAAVGAAQKSASARGFGARTAHTHSSDSSNGGLTAKQTRRLAKPLAKARAATAKYATDLELAQADGYRMTITQMIPDMGHHFLNPDITEFDVTKPPILVYVRNGSDWQLVGFEWVFPEKPEKRPLPGASYGSFPAACHYEDGLFVSEKNESACSETNPESGSPFSFWHPKLVTLHAWVWYPNPDGLFSGTNPWVRPFNDEQI